MSRCSMPFQTAAFMGYAPFGVRVKGESTPSRGEETPDLLDPRDTGAAAQAGAFQRRDRVGESQYIPSLPPLQQPVQKCAVKHITGAGGVHHVHGKAGGLDDLAPVQQGRTRLPLRQADARGTETGQRVAGYPPGSVLPVSVRAEPSAHDEDIRQSGTTPPDTGWAPPHPPRPGMPASLAQRAAWRAASPSWPSRCSARPAQTASGVRSSGLQPDAGVALADDGPVAGAFLHQDDAEAVGDAGGHHGPGRGPAPRRSARREPADRSRCCRTFRCSASGGRAGAQATMAVAVRPPPWIVAPRASILVLDSGKWGIRNR